MTRPRLFNRWIALSTGLKSILRITQLVSLVLIRLIVIYPVDNAIQIFNNQGLELNSKRLYQRKKTVVAHCSRPPQNLKLDIFKL